MMVDYYWTTQGWQSDSTGGIHMDP
eukprot:SAG22_NODE_3770_length_1536_cov_2.702157_1_plen_24_part_10